LVDGATLAYECSVGIRRDRELWRRQPISRRAVDGLSPVAGDAVVAAPAVPVSRDAKAFLGREAGMPLLTSGAPF
jgi:hypothetical protein